MIESRWHVSVGWSYWHWWPRKYFPKYFFMENSTSLINYLLGWSRWNLQSWHQYRDSCLNRDLASRRCRLTCRYRTSHPPNSLRTDIELSCFDRFQRTDHWHSSSCRSGSNPKQRNHIRNNQKIHLLAQSTSETLITITELIALHNSAVSVLARKRASQCSGGCCSRWVRVDIVLA